MAKRILFSPVGGTDPISLKNFHDGSLLHICRKYRPDEIILYMSKEILAFHEEDDRYRFSLTKLYEFMGAPMPEIRIEARPDLEDVQEFDDFYEDFNAIIQEILKGMSRKDELLLNISSGTPAMKSGLLVLATMYGYRAKTIQVVTPEKKMNEHTHEGYDNETVWAMNLDNKEGWVDRCREVYSPTLFGMKRKESIRDHVLNYDYETAYSLSKELANVGDSSYVDLILMGKRRRELDLQGVRDLIKKTGYNCFVIREPDSCLLVEYTLNLQALVQRKQYTDFVRAVTPAIFQLFKLLLLHDGSLDIDNYLNRRKDGAIVWNLGKVHGTDIEKSLESDFMRRGKTYYWKGFVTSSSLIVLIKDFCRTGKAIDLADSVRNAEEYVRNMAAHEIVNVSNGMIREKTGFTAKEIVTMIEKLFPFAGMDLPKEAWNSYDLLNAEILRQME